MASEPGSPTLSWVYAHCFSLKGEAALTKGVEFLEQGRKKQDKFLLKTALACSRIAADMPIIRSEAQNLAGVAAFELGYHKRAIQHYRQALDAQQPDSTYAREEIVPNMRWALIDSIRDVSYDIEIRCEYLAILADSKPTKAQAQEAETQRQRVCVPAGLLLTEAEQLWRDAEGSWERAEIAFARRADYVQAINPLSKKDKAECVRKNNELFMTLYPMASDVYQKLKKQIKHPIDGRSDRVAKKLIALVATLESIVTAIDDCWADPNTAGKSIVATDSCFNLTADGALALGLKFLGMIEENDFATTLLATQCFRVAAKKGRLAVPANHSIARAYHASGRTRAAYTHLLGFSRSYGTIPKRENKKITASLDSWGLELAEDETRPNQARCEYANSVLEISKELKERLRAQAVIETSCNIEPISAPTKKLTTAPTAKQIPSKDRVARNGTKHGRLISKRARKPYSAVSHTSGNLKEPSVHGNFLPVGLGFSDFPESGVGIALPFQVGLSFHRKFRIGLTMPVYWLHNSASPSNVDDVDDDFTTAFFVGLHVGGYLHRDKKSGVALDAAFGPLFLGERCIEWSKPRMQQSDKGDQETHVDCLKKNPRTYSSSFGLNLTINDGGFNVGSQFFADGRNVLVGVYIALGR